MPPLADAAQSFLVAIFGVVMVLGWVTLIAIWWFVFRGRDEQGNRRDKG